MSGPVSVRLTAPVTVPGDRLYPAQAVIEVHPLFAARLIGTGPAVSIEVAVLPRADRRLAAAPATRGGGDGGD